MEVFIATTGNDAWEGSSARPYASLEGARAGIRERHRRDPGFAAKVTVWLRAGTYRLAHSFRLNADDALPMPIEFRAWPGDAVRLTGGQSLSATAFKAVTQADLLQRMEPAARGKVLVCDLAAGGIQYPKTATSHGFAFPDKPSDPELFINDRPMPLSRWPKSGALFIDTVTDAGTLLSQSPTRGATFTCTDPRVARWSQARHALCHGQWMHDWAPSTVPVQAVAGAAGAITLGESSFYGVRNAKRIVMMNLLEEIGEPGEWYVDRAEGLLYLWPPQGFAEASIEMSFLNEPLITVADVQHVAFHDLIIECGRSLGVVLGGKDNLLSGCELRNFGRHAVTVEGSGNRVVGCHIHDCGQGGIFLGGGDRRTLTPAGNVAENNHIHTWNRVVRTYRPGIWLTGVGQRASRNLIHDAPHFGLWLHGNDHVMDRNEICDVCLDTDDAGAFYMGRNPSERGNVLRENFFHHVGTGRDAGTAAVYVDDGASGLEVRGNIFFRTGNRGTLGMGAIAINSGKDMIIEDNVFAECPRAVGVMLTTQSGWDHHMSDTDPGTDAMHAHYRRCLYQEVDITKPPYTTRYPELLTLTKNPSRNRIANNLVHRCTEFVLGLERQDAVGNRFDDSAAIFRDPLALDFSLASESPARVETAMMGIDAKAFRFALPELRRRLDIAVTLTGRPQQSSASSTVQGQMSVTICNRSAQTQHGEVEVFSMPVTAKFAEGEVIAYTLAPGATSEHQLTYRVEHPHNRELILCARERRRDAVAAFAQGEIQMHHALSAKSPLRFRDDAGAVVGEIQFTVVGNLLQVSARIRDSRATAEKTPWRTATDAWQGPFVGLFLDDVTPTCVRQLVFFPKGPTGDELWYLRGPDRQPTPASVTWNTQVDQPGTYTLSASIPLSAIDLEVTAAGFRLQGMVQVPEASRVLPLFGSITAYNNAQRFALFTP